MTKPPTNAPDGAKGTPGRIIKVNHAGEFGAINIYSAQLALAPFTAPALVSTLREFRQHERHHLEVFGAVLSERGIRRCRSYYFCGMGGWLLGFLTALLGRPGILTCTAAVEEVVTSHLREQIHELELAGDLRARDAVASILADEEEHLSVATDESRDYWLYKPVRAVVALSTEAVIWLGMKI